MGGPRDDVLGLAALIDALAPLNDGLPLVVDALALMDDLAALNPNRAPKPPPPPLGVYPGSPCMGTWVWVTTVMSVSSSPPSGEVEDGGDGALASLLTLNRFMVPLFKSSV